MDGRRPRAGFRAGRLVLPFTLFRGLCGWGQEPGALSGEKWTQGPQCREEEGACPAGVAGSHSLGSQRQAVCDADFQRP